MDGDGFRGLVELRLIPTIEFEEENSCSSFWAPEHSQMSNTDQVERLRHCNLPPIAAVDSKSIAIGNLPIHFSWNNRMGSANGEGETMKSTEQNMQELQPPLGQKDSQPVLQKVSNSRVRVSSESSVSLGGRRGQEKLTGAENENDVNGPAQMGPSIEDLFFHSYSPPPNRSAKPRLSHWVWVTAARVWDSSTERFSCECERHSKIWGAGEAPPSCASKHDGREILC